MIDEIVNFIKGRPTATTITKLGEGGQGTVYRINNYVIKQMPLLYVSQTATFVAEANTWAELYRNVKFRSYMPTYRGFDIVKRTLPPAEYTSLNSELRNNYLSAWGDGYLFQNYESVDDLHTIINRRRPTTSKIFTSTKGAKLIEELNYALGLLHSVGYVHRDIKLENILIRRVDGSPIIIDFGLVCKLPCDEEITSCGTLNYLPPNVLPKSVRTIQTRKFKVQPNFVGWLKQIIGCNEQKIVSIKVANRVVRIRAGTSQDRYALSIVVAYIIRNTAWIPKNVKLSASLDIYYKLKHAIVPYLAAATATTRRVRRDRKN